jgi:GH24 family phage-related lysozyme (muramidase)
MMRVFPNCRKRGIINNDYPEKGLAAVEDSMMSMVLLPGAVAVFVAILSTWAWTHDYEEIAAEMQRAIKEDDGKTTVGILWRRASIYMR